MAEEQQQASRDALAQAKASEPARTQEGGDDRRDGDPGSSRIPDGLSEQKTMPVKQDGMIGEIQRKTHNFRVGLVKALPRFIVNNSVTLISALHLGSELLMLKSGGLKFLKNNRGGEEVNYFIDPLNNLWRGLRGLDKEMAGGKAAQNVWGLRSTAVGFMGWTVGTFMPNKKDDGEVIKRDKALFENSKMDYIGQRTVEALQPWKSEYKRQFVGLAITAAGVCSALSGLTNIGGNGKFYFNKSRTIGGVITAVAGGALLYSVTDRDAWARYGMAIWMRLPFIGMSVNKMYRKTMEFKGAADIEAFAKANNEWKYYGSGAAGFQTASTLSYLFGGEQKLPDGTIVDDRKVKGKPPAHASHHRDEETAMPTTTVSRVAVHEAVDKSGPAVS